jgi:hypothetical protein
VRKVIDVVGRTLVVGSLLTFLLMLEKIAPVDASVTILPYVIIGGAAGVVFLFITWILGRGSARKPQRDKQTKHEKLRDEQVALFIMGAGWGLFGVMKQYLGDPKPFEALSSVVPGAALMVISLVIAIKRRRLLKKNSAQE